MKKTTIYSIIIASAAMFCACGELSNDYTTYPVTVELKYPAGSPAGPTSGVLVKLTGSTGNPVFESETNEEGIAVFAVPAGIYEVSSSSKEAVDNYTYNYNGIKTNIPVTAGRTDKERISLELVVSKSAQIIIKEIYNGGCQRNDGSGTFQNDKYVILYNNSEKQANLKDLCLTVVTPANAQATNNDYGTDGKLSYETAGWIPSGGAFLYFAEDAILQPFEEAVIALANAVDHTVTYRNSINFANESYYCVYDPLTYTGHASPSDRIPTSHYLKAHKFATGTMFIVSVTSPAIFIFKPTGGITPQDLANDTDRDNYHGNTVSAANKRKKIDVDWVLDGVEVFTNSSSANKKRLTAAIDAGYVYLTHYYGHTLYRNVDKEATEAITGNEGKLIYNYDLGVDGHGDPNGIDAEASSRNGAHIIYMDTNNSANDFHERTEASLRYNK
ncbi:MAG: DUF4876 domain-containing protein [Mediterranea sp.]|jgi:hypothetical protein|nr:DUF4876 domain-containing protein [Mediterranea sp.]